MSDSTKENGRKINEALIAKYGAYLRPGEAMAAVLDITEEYALVRVVLAATDESFRFEIAGALEFEVEHKAEVDEAEAWSVVLDFLDLQLEEFFESDRVLVTHEDWRVYEYLGYSLKFQGIHRKPELEKLADQWLRDAGVGLDGLPEEEE
ncbi:hypothetical protein FRD01_01770 [Microvenator marinus]|uniref:Uncharacterized protein n=1 Tax=Microvenator marinus TaxID=2600177 RepID=A0A5B8XLP3_9DELT|nr:hypothetical protein [Microvenator marinus]QED26007.1 hypothetical protein FRD01_01770 [Microvenator marinus]